MCKFISTVLLVPKGIPFCSGGEGPEALPLDDAAPAGLDIPGARSRCAGDKPHIPSLDHVGR